MDCQEPGLCCRNRYEQYTQRHTWWDSYKSPLSIQLLKQWRSFRRALLHFDPSCTGRVPAVLFQAVLERHGVHLTQEQTCGLMESLDPQHTGIVNYTSFVSLLTD